MEVIVNIKGKDWKYKLLSDKTYDKLHGDTSNGITLPDECEVHIRKSTMNSNILRHESFHVFYFSSLVETADLTALQTEEIACEIFGEHGPEMMSICDYVLNKFLLKKRKALKEE